MQEVRVIAIGFDPAHSQPLLLLREVIGRRRVLPVWVGAPEASAIELERRGISTPRPTTHRLICSVIEASGRRLDAVCITMVRDSVFHAELLLDNGTTVSARVSDAVALALHVGVPIRSEDAVLEEVGLEDPTLVGVPDEEDDEGAAPDQAEEIERFRRFLDEAAPEDFGRGES